MLLRKIYNEPPGVMKSDVIRVVSLCYCSPRRVNGLGEESGVSHPHYTGGASKTCRRFESPLKTMNDAAAVVSRLSWTWYVCPVQLTKHGSDCK